MTQRVVEQWFEPDLSSAAGVRRFVRAATEQLALDEGPLVLMASELASNAICHAGTRFCVRVIEDGHHVRVEVIDESPTELRVRRSDLTSDNGRGLSIVGVLAADWGVEPLPGGKRVWFETGSRP
jgi:anti-sigma regulatory factor (Ser/Thr protein kinase)